MFFRKRSSPPGRSPRQVRAIRVFSGPEEGGTIQELMAFLSPAWESVEFLEHPARVRMTHGKRSFVAYGGEWIVNPSKGAYYPMKNDEFNRVYELVESN